MTGLFLQLFWSFFVIGLFTVGGGYAVIGVIQSQIVMGRGWITESSFTDIVAISQITPGPVGLNCSTYVGYEVLHQAGASEFLSSLGALTSSFAIVLPSFLIMLLIVRFYTKFHQTPVFKGVMRTLKPVVAGMIGAAALALIVSVSLSDSGIGISLLQDNFPGWKSWALFVAAFCAYTFLDAGPVTIIAAGAVLGLLIF